MEASVEHDISGQREEVEGSTFVYVYPNTRYYYDSTDIPPHPKSKEYNMPHRRKEAAGHETDPLGRDYPLSKLDPDNPEDKNMVEIKDKGLYVRILKDQGENNEPITRWVRYNGDPKKGKRPHIHYT